MKQAVIVDCIRTPMGRSKAGVFRNVRAETLSAELMKALVERNPKLDPNTIEDVIWGNVTQVMENGGCLARASVLLSHFDDSVPGLAINRF